MGLEQRENQYVKKRKPLNSLGTWVESFAAETGVNKKTLAREFQLPGLFAAVSTSPETSISLYTLEHVLQGASQMGATEDQMDSLRNVVADIIEKTIAEKGKLYDRLPPSAPRTIAKDLNCTTYTDTSLATEIRGAEDRPIFTSKINAHRRKLGFAPIFTAQQAEQVKKSIVDTAQKRAEASLPKSRFRRNIMASLNIPEESFKNIPWFTSTREIPNPEEFGNLLAATKLSEEERDYMVSLWLDAYRDTTPLSSEAYLNEFSSSPNKLITRQALNHLAHRLDPERKLSKWETIEKIREYRADRRSNRSALSSQTIKLSTYYASVETTARNLGKKNVSSLTPEDIERM